MVKSFYSPYPQGLSESSGPPNSMISMVDHHFLVKLLQLEVYLHFQTHPYVTATTDFDLDSYDSDDSSAQGSSQYADL